MSGKKKWRADEDRFIEQARHAGATLPQLQQALSERFGRGWTQSQIESRLQRLRMTADPFKWMYPDCELYYLSVCVPWVPPETRAWLDSVTEHHPLVVPV